MQMVAPKLMAEDSANNFSQNSESEENSPPASASSTPTGAEAQVLEDPFHRMDICETPHSVEEPPEPQQPTQPAVHPTQPDLQPTQPVVQPSLPVPHPPRVGSQYRMPAEPCFVYDVSELHYQIIDISITGISYKTSTQHVFALVTAWSLLMKLTVSCCSGSRGERQDFVKLDRWHTGSCPAVFISQSASHRRGRLGGCYRVLSSHWAYCW